MKKSLVLSLIVFGLLFSPQHGHAQDFGEFRFSLFECITATCEDELLPTVSGVALVIAHAECNNGINLNRQASITVGVPLPCLLPLSGRVFIQEVRDPFVDDCGLPDFIDSMVGDLEVFDFFDDLVFSGSSDDDCAGGQGAETHGVIPCGVIDD